MTESIKILITEAKKNIALRDVPHTLKEDAWIYDWRARAIEYAISVLEDAE